MPSDKKRERQQRVRHEAGPAESEPNPNSVNSNGRPSPPVDVVKTINDKDTRISNEKKAIDKNQTNVRVKKLDTRIRIGGKNQRTANQLSKEFQKKSSSVAYAEETQYESVSIMGSPIQEEAPKSKVPVQYQRREVISNWFKYDQVPREIEIQEGEDYLIGEDYAEVIKLQGANKNTEGHLQLKSELSWGEDHSDHLANYGFGALKVLDLCAAISTIPFHEQIKIPEKLLPTSDIQMWNNIASDNAKTYEPNKIYATNMEVNEKILESLRLTESDSIKLPSEEIVVEKHCVNDIMQKFSDAFPKEATDVDLDQFSTSERESSTDRDPSSPPYSLTNGATNSSLIEQNTVIKPSLTNNKSSSSKISNKNSSSKPGAKSSSEPAEKSFNFRLPSNKLKEVIVVPELVKSYPTKQSIDEVSIEDTVVSLEEPLATPSLPSNSVDDTSKTEMEDLEDWLDSVLDE